MAAVEFDPFSATFFDEPYDHYRRLRDEAPVYFSGQYQFFALSRYEDVAAAQKNWATFSSAHGVDLNTLSTDPELIASLRSIIMMDPPAHDRFRALVSRVFTPKAIQAMEPLVRRVVDRYLDELEGRETFDAVDELSGPFPVEIIAELLGVPPADRQQIRHWLDVMLHREPGDLRQTQAGAEASLALGTYFFALTAAKRSDPGDDLTSRLTQTTVDRGDGDETALDDAEIAGFSALLGGAGAETVTKLVGNAFVLFHRYPDQWRKVLDDPTKIAAAVEEILRFWPPSQYQGRFSKQTAEIRGATVPAGFPVLLVTGSATRDERFFEAPDTFEIDRPPSHALSFGVGVHSCLGAALARMESRVVLEAMVERWPRFRVDEEGLERVQMSNVAGFSKVPVIVE